MSMGVYIKGMEMPKNCFDCPLFDDVYTDADGDDDYSCSLGVPLDYYQGSGETKKDCPLIPIPAHGRLIDEKYIVPKDGYIIADGMTCIPVKDIVNAPTIIPADPEEEEMK